MASYQYVYVMKNLSRTYPGGREVLKNVTLAFLPGAKIGVLGVNGSGKSTLMKIMAGLDKDYTGEAFVAEGAKVGYLSQEPHLDPAKTVMENIVDGLGESLPDVLDTFMAGRGILKSRTAGLTTTIEDLEAQIVKQGLRLEKVETRIRRQFTSLEVTMGQLQATGAFVTAQLAAMSPRRN